MKKMILLPDEERVTQWYNVMTDMPGGMLVWFVVSQAAMRAAW